MADSLMQFLRGGGPEVAQPVQQAAAQPVPEWVPWVPPELTPEEIAARSQAGIGGPPTQEEFGGPTQSQQALMGVFGEEARQEAGQSLLSYLKSHPPEGWDAVQEDNTYHTPMTQAASGLMDRLNYPNDLPNRIRFDGGSFRLDDQFSGPDLFGGQLPKEMLMRDMPRALQPLLGPSVAQHYANSQANLWAPGWSGYWAPPVQLMRPEDKPWTGNTYYDAWHRALGALPNALQNG